MEKLNMTKSEFKAHFLATFLASYAAQRYDDACMRGDQDKLSNHPIEDAEHLAETAWEKYIWSNIRLKDIKEEMEAKNGFC
jgi:hypothetical protein